MNTNDPAAKYGKPMLGDPDLVLLMDDEAEDFGVDDENEDGRFAWMAMLEAARAVRSFYENLIHEGRLRVVEEVELVPPIWNCSGKGCGWDGAQPGPYCPGCGNKIKP